MERDGSDLGVASPKFQPCQIVRIKTTAELEDPGFLVPLEHSMGKTGVVELEGRVYTHGPGRVPSMEQAYFVRIDGIGPVLAGEDWLEDAETTGPPGR